MKFYPDLLPLRRHPKNLLEERGRVYRPRATLELEHRACAAAQFGLGRRAMATSEDYRAVP